MSWTSSCLPGLAAQFQLHRNGAEIGYGLLVDESRGEGEGIAVRRRIGHASRLSWRPRSSGYACRASSDGRRDLIQGAGSAIAVTVAGHVWDGTRNA